MFALAGWRPSLVVCSLLPLSSNYPEEEATPSQMALLGLSHHRVQLLVQKRIKEENGTCPLGDTAVAPAFGYPWRFPVIPCHTV